MSRYSRRDFLKTGAGLGAAALLAGGPATAADGGGAAGGAPAGTLRVVSSGNGIRATDKAMEIMRAGGDPLDAVIAGVNIVEDDPNDMSVGYGGLPNEDGVVELDASVMYGPTHAAGRRGRLRNIKNPSKVARLVMERTDHCPARRRGRPQVRPGPRLQGGGPPDRQGAGGLAADGRRRCRTGTTGSRRSPRSCAADLGPSS